MPRKEQCVEECIHGLEVGLCDVCYPKAAPEPVRAVRPAATSRPTTRQPRSATSESGSTQSVRGGVSGGSARATHATTSKRSIVASQQRIYHVTHVRNLDAILESRELRADAAPIVDVSTPLTRELRATVELPGNSSAVPNAPDRALSSVGSRVAFYLSPDAALWNDLRSGAADEVRWSTAARNAAASDFVILVSTIGPVRGQSGGPVGGQPGGAGGGAIGGQSGGAVGGQRGGEDGGQVVSDVFVTDGDAAGTYTRFFTDDALQRAVERAHDSETIGLGAEVLAGGVVDFASIQLIGVANDPARDRVRELVVAAGFATKVAVYPPWFQPT